MVNACEITNVPQIKSFQSDQALLPSSDGATNVQHANQTLELDHLADAEVWPHTSGQLAE